MFYSQEAYDEHAEAMFNESLSQGAYMSAAVREYAANHGAMERDRAWILSPFDTWEPNPYYVGTPVHHPEFGGDDYFIPFDDFKAASVCAADIAKTFNCSAKIYRLNGGWVAEKA